MNGSIEPWHIYFVPECRQAIPKPKEKLIAIVCVSDNPKGFMISSEIDVWIQIDPEKMACQALILGEEHSCLKHDSYVNCVNLLSFFEEELVEKRDKLSDNAKESIRAAVENSSGIERRYKRIILRE
jgi:hypothetical protein